MAEENKLSFKYSEGKGTTTPTNDDPNTLYLTNGRLYKGNVLIADKSPDTYPWDKITAKPTNLAGYGIVDGATQSGYYPNMRVGLADDLGDLEERVDSEYMMQPTAKDENIRDDYAHIESLEGNSLAWNQLFFFKKTVVNNGVTFTYNGDGSYTVDGTATADAYIILFSLYGNREIHKYAMTGCPAGGSPSTYYLGGAYIWNNAASVDLGSGVVLTDRYQEYADYIGIHIKKGYTANNLVFRPRLHDLTQMFSEGNEPTTIEEFEARKPKVANEYAYNKGEIISFNGDAIKSVGFNQFDGQLEQGRINQVDGNSPSQDMVRSKNYIPVISGANYYFNVPRINDRVVYVYLYYYDKDNKYISSTYFHNEAPDRVQTIPSNAAFMRFFLYQSESSLKSSDFTDKICINLSNPAKNGTYEPYRQFTRNLPRRGELRSAGTAYDEIYYNHDIRKYVKVTRMAKVKLADLSNWRQIAVSDGSYKFMSIIISNKSTSVSANTIKILCNAYTAIFPTYYSNASADKSITESLTSGEGARVYITDNSYTDVESFVAHLQAVNAELIYELAEPIETVLSDIEYMDYYVENGGTEQVLSENNTTPIRTTTVYNFDAVSTIRQNRFDVSELKSGYLSLSSKVSTAETNISNLSSYVAQNTSDIDSIKRNVSTLSGSVAANTTNISNIVNGTTAVGNADKVDGYHYYSSVLYRDSVYLTNNTNAKWYVKIELLLGWNADFQKILINANYNNTQGKLLIEFDSYLLSQGYQIRSSSYNGSNIEAYAATANSGKIILYFRFREYTSCSCNIWSSAQMNYCEIVDASEVPELTELSRGIYTNYKINGTITQADKLATPRSIWGQSFDGSGNVSGNVTGSNFLLMDRSDNPLLQLTDTGGTVYFQNVNGVAYMGSTASRSLLVDKQGNVGIGTTTPAYKLDVAGTGRFTGDLTVSTINGGTPITSSNIASQSVSKATYATFIGDSNEQLGYQSLNDALDQITALENAIDALPDTYSPIAGSASLTTFSGGTFGNAAAKNYTTSVQSGNANLVTSAAVYTAIDNLRQEVRVAFPSMATLSAYSLNGSTLNCYIESEDNIDLWSDLSAGAVLFVVIQDGASVEGTFNKISAKYDGSSDTTEIAVRQSPGLYSGYGCVLVSTGSLDISQGGISIVYPVAAS